jgi:transposase InsO family protein
MALKALSMAELRKQVLLEPELTGETVAAVCRRHGISRETYYKYRRRYLQEGLDGLEDRSRRPHRSSGQIDEDVEVEICRMRKDHPRWGARRIRAELTRAGMDPPAVSTIHQALKRNHLIAQQPARKQRFDKRFQREISNDLWQIDATQVRLVDHKKVWVLDTIDDHSRFLLAAVACQSPTGDAAWDCFELAASRYGLPREVLSDNGFCFTGRLAGVEVAFEVNLKELGVKLINSGPYHPQTLGKLERFHKTLKQWLADEGPVTDIYHLQELLDAFRYYYNKSRPHQALEDSTPEERYQLKPSKPKFPTPAIPRPQAEEGFEEPTYPPHSIIRKVTLAGNVGYNRKYINVGRRWTGAKVRVVRVGALIHIYYGDMLLRALTIDPNVHYQGRNLRPRKGGGATRSVI